MRSDEAIQGCVALILTLLLERTEGSTCIVHAAPTFLARPHLPCGHLLKTSLGTFQTGRYTIDMEDVNGVQFEEPSSSGIVRGEPRMMYAKVVPSNEPPQVVTWLMDHGISEQQAVNILIGLALIIFGGSMYLFFFNDPPTKADIIAEWEEAHPGQP